MVPGGMKKTGLVFMLQIWEMTLGQIFTLVLIYWKGLKQVFEADFYGMK